jgi:hypothetical protein
MRYGGAARVEPGAMFTCPVCDAADVTVGVIGEIDQSAAGSSATTS